MHSLVLNILWLQDSANVQLIVSGDGTNLQKSSVCKDKLT